MKDRIILRDLAEQYIEICRNDVQNERRVLWRKHNSLQRTRIPIYIRSFAWNEMPESQCKCQDPFFRGHENVLRQKIFWHSLDDDSIFEPWINQPAAYKCTGWGVDGVLNTTEYSGGAYKEEHPQAKLSINSKGEILSTLGLDFSNEQLDSLGRFSQGSFLGTGKKKTVW